MIDFHSYVRLYTHNDMQHVHYPIESAGGPENDDRIWVPEPMESMTFQKDGCSQSIYDKTNALSRFVIGIRRAEFSGCHLKTATTTTTTSSTCMRVP